MQIKEITLIWEIRKKIQLDEPQMKSVMDYSTHSYIHSPEYEILAKTICPGSTSMGNI